MATFLIIVGVFFVLLAVYIPVSKMNRKRQLERCASELEQALDAELVQTQNRVEATIAPVKEKMEQESDPLKRMVYEAFIENYPRIQLRNLFFARKSVFENRPDFNLDFVREFYERNNSLISEYSKLKEYDIEPLLSPQQKLLYGGLSSAYSCLSMSGYLVSGVSSRPVKLEPSAFFCLKVGDNEIPTFKSVLDGEVRIYPTFLVDYKGGSEIAITDLKGVHSYDNVRFHTRSEEHTEHNTSLLVPYDAEVIGYEWKYMTKKGEPDARYSDNPRYTRIRRCQVALSSSNVFFATTSFAEADRLQKTLECLISGDVEKYLSYGLATARQEPDTRKNDPAYLLKEYITHDSMFLDIVRYVAKQGTIYTSQLQRMFSIGYNRAGKYLDQMEQLGFVGIPLGARPREVKIDSEYVDSLLDESDGKNPEPANRPKENSDATKELDSLIGLDEVKTEITALQNFIKIQLVRQSQGLKTPPMSYHCVFTGNPGTGKTTVARIVAQIYRDLGVLSKGHLVETDRSGLIAEYVGQTAVKTNKVIDSALDGVLFIDEAYSLLGGLNDFGPEAIATLLKRMEDDRERLVVILAGYGDEMRKFIDSNPGLQSRFNRYIHFEDYDTDELVSIFELNLKRHQYRMTDSAKALVRSYICNAVDNKDRNFGNGRFVRNLFERTLQLQATRLSNSGDFSKDALQQIVDEDIPVVH